MSIKECEVLVIGAGPNGLTAAAYLAKAGVDVLLIDSQVEEGGGLATEIVTIAPFLHNTHSIYHMMVDAAPVYQDLHLMDKYGVKYVRPELQWAMPTSDGRFIGIYTDLEKTCQSIAQFSQKDAESYRNIHGRLEQYFTEFLGPATYVPPMSTLEMVVKMQSCEIGQELFEYSEKTPQDIVYGLFENEQVRTMMLYIACHWGLEHDVSGVGYLACLYLQRATNYRLAVGGSHTVASAMNREFIYSGGMTLGSKCVTRILVEDGVAVGVQTRDGDEIRATKAILSTINPENTFLNCIGEENIDPQLAAKTKMWQWDKWSLLTVHLAMEEPPQFKAAAANPEFNKALIYVLGYENTDQLLEHWANIKEGKIKSGDGYSCCFPSVHDPRQAPEGRCTGFLSQLAPYSIEGGAERWLGFKFKERLVENMVGTLSKYCTNIDMDKLMGSYVCTPADIPNKFPSMTQGSIKHGAYAPLQMGYNRPNDECSMYRTPVKNLYLGGASSHPGGFITFGAGYNAANTIAEDLGVTKWWSEPESVTAAKNAGLL